MEVYRSTCLLVYCFDQLIIAYIGICMDEERKRSSIVPMVLILIGLAPASQKGHALIIVRTYLQDMDNILNGTTML